MTTYIVMRIIGFVGQPPFGDDRPMYVAAYSPDGPDGRGVITACTTAAFARFFPDQETALLCYVQQSKSHPLRSDGQPNRPLTRFAIALETIETDAWP